eukprot:gnl/MRDRNA2_/MRDRNA2_177363_c0_seq1.p1 gnl/MRDRNA2_/MRDRNA2_177363_c0~~gnl/MRDRNA2_/MRDRNA2_177363_c0_seq1.p1  ORF type:complete len:599 (-),score=70.55 gnl/MRDRNA2_/MRDRNA2_177363_c0_seq1:102-1793(-)
MSRSECKLENCNVHSIRDCLDNEGPVQFNYGDLTEEYRGDTALNLAHPYHRAILALLISRAKEMHKSSPYSCLQDPSLDGKTFKIPTNLDMLPKQGTLQFDFRCDVSQWTDCKSTHEFLLQWNAMRRVPITLQRFAMVMSILRQLETESELHLFLDAACRDLLLKLSQVKHLLQEIGEKNPVVVPFAIDRLGAAMERSDWTSINSILSVTMIRKPSNAKGARKATRKLRTEAMQALSKLQALSAFNAENPTGHYYLDLSQPLQYQLCEILIAADRWEAHLAQSRGVMDITQAGGYHAIRNLEHNATRFLLRDSWMLPGDGYIGEGILVFDWISPIHHQREWCCATPDDVLGRLIASMLDTHAAPLSRFHALVGLSHRLWLLPKQASDLLRCFVDMDLRTELFVRLFPRCLDFGAPFVDLSNGIIRTDLAPDAINILHSRLGPLNVFDALHIEAPEQCRYSIDLFYRDARLKMEYILHMAIVEPGENMIDVDWTGAIRSSEAVSGFYVPSTWLKELPTHGIVSFTYQRGGPDASFVRPDVRLSETQKRFGWLVTEAPKDDDELE